MSTAGGSVAAGGRRRRPAAHERRTGGTVPWPLAVPATIAVLFLVVPLGAMLLRAPWSSLPRILEEGTVLEALRLSLVCATAATVVSLLAGVPLAWVLARARLRGLALLRALVILPLVLPPVVGGVALLLAFGRLGVVGRYLDLWFGFTLPFTTLGVVVAAAFVAMPFLVVTVEGAFRSLDRGYEEAAVTLGASRLTTFRRVTLPLVGPSLVAGSVLCWARALGEFGATITFAGNFPRTTQTLPLLTYLKLESNPPEAIITRTAATTMAMIHRTQSMPGLPFPPKAV